MKVPTFVGTRRSINAKYLFSPTMTEAMPIPIRASVKAPHHNNAAWGAKPTGGGVFLRPGCAQRKSAARSLGHAEPSEVLSTRCPCLRRGTTRHRHREMPHQTKAAGRYTERLFFAAPSLLVLPPDSNRLLTLCSLRESGCQQIGGRRVCLTRKGPLPAPLVFAVTRAFPHHGHLRNEQAIAIW
jgi:hypothetical protein